MRQTNLIKTSLLVISTFTALFLVIPRHAAAHCDTLDGPVIQDARKAIDGKDITPVLKWVKQKDEHAVQEAFQKVLAATTTGREAVEHAFFETLVKIHREGEGAPFAGLKPAGAVEPAVAEADKALAGGSSDVLVKLITRDVAAGIEKRYAQAAAAYKHKDESVAQGREFVEAYVTFTHYVERLHQDATATGSHAEHAEHGDHTGHAAEPAHANH